MKKLILALALVIVLAAVGAVFYVMYGFMGLRLLPNNNSSKEPQIINTSTYTNSTIETTYVYGEVQNTLDVNIRRVVVNGTFYDSVGKLIRIDACMVFPIILKPNQKGFFVLYGPQRAVRHELSLKYEPTEETPVEGLTIIVHGSFINNGYFKITGEVKNDGRERVTGVTLDCAFYDSAGRVTGWDFTHTNPDYIYSGQSAPFQLDWEIQNCAYAPTSYKLQVEAEVG